MSSGISRVTISFIAALSLIAGCGGGGGGGGSTSIDLGPPAAITVENSSKLAIAASNASETTLTSGSEVFTALDLVANSMSAPAGAASAMKAATQTQSGTVNGAVGGWASFTMTADQNTGNGTYSIDFNNFSEMPGETVNGSVRITMNSSESGFSFGVSMNGFSYQNTNTGENFSATGTMTMSASGDMSAVSVTANMITSDGVTSSSLGNFTLSVTSDGVQDTLSINGGISTSDGAIYLTTVQTIVADGAGGSYPSAGVLRIRGAGVMQLTFIDPTQVLVEVDADADGVFEYSQVRLWSDIEAEAAL